MAEKTANAKEIQAASPGRKHGGESQPITPGTKEDK